MILTTDPDTAVRLNIGLAVPIAYRVMNIYGEVAYGEDKQDLIRDLGGDSVLLAVDPLYIPQPND